MNDKPLLECPRCGKPALKRLVSAPRFRLKGTGWYETDFKKDKQKNVLKSDSEAVKSDSKTEPSKAKKKPEPKPGAKSEN